MASLRSLTMKRLFSNPIFLYVVDDQSNYIDDLKQTYSQSSKYILKEFSSPQLFIDSLSGEKPSAKKIRIALIALRPASLQESSPEVLTQKLLLEFPDLHIIKISSEKEMPADESYKRSGNLIFVLKNENTLLRIDNSIKWIIARRTLERKEMLSRKATRAFLLVLVVFTITFLFFRLAFPHLLHF
jgi:hypothetical protein